MGRDEPSAIDREGLIDWPDGTDWKCDECGESVPDQLLEEHECPGPLQRVNRAYFWPGGRRDVVVQYAGHPVEEDPLEEEDSRS